MERKPATAKPRQPNTAEIIAEQKRVAAKDTAARKVAAPVPATVATNTAVAMPDNRTPVQRYVDEIAPANIVGRLVKFGKEGTFITADDGEPVPDTTDFLALCTKPWLVG